MTSEEFRYLIPGYLSGGLSADEKKMFEERLETDGELRRELAELETVWKDLGEREQEQPSPFLRARFYRKLDDISNRQARLARGGFAWWKPGLAGLVRQGVVAAALFALGLFVGREKSAGPSSEQMDQLHTQVQELRQTVALSLMDRQSATSRLEGVSWSMQVDQLDPELRTALVRALNHDPNTNVRLASLDALEKFTRDKNVRQALVGSIGQQDSPLVQIALIDSLVHIQDRTAAGELRRLAEERGVNSAVQERARWGLQKLSLN
ncbi:MAG: HEAT repeat domain-containing protein [Bryobacteraceae bacterium]